MHCCCKLGMMLFSLGAKHTAMLCQQLVSRWLRLVLPWEAALHRGDPRVLLHLIPTPAAFGCLPYHHRFTQVFRGRLLDRLLLGWAHANWKGWRLLRNRATDKKKPWRPAMKLVGFKLNSDLRLAARGGRNQASKQRAG